jgi:hypothetical protein
MPRARDPATTTRMTRCRETLKKKAQELATLCDVDVALICSCPGSRGFLWPSQKAVQATCRRFNALPPEEQERNSEDAADLSERDKLATAREGGVAGTLGSWDVSLEAMTVEKLRELLASIDASLAAAGSRAVELEGHLQSGEALDRESVPPGPVHADEVAAETSVSVRASGASDGAGPRWGEHVSAPPLEENPKTTNAAPLIADQVAKENSVPAPAPDAGRGVRRRPCEVDAGGDTLELLLQANPGTPNAAPWVADEGADDEGEDVHILPGPGDADDAEWVRGLVEALKEASPPSNAAPYRSGTEYLYMGGGGAIERDAYDFIRFDLGMPPPPPYVAPDSPEPDYGEPLKLWPWE